MAGEDEEVIVHIDEEVLGDGVAGTADTAAKTDVKVAGAETVTPKAKADDPLESLKSQFSTLQSTAAETQRQRDDALRAAAEANQRAENAHREATEAKVQVVDSQLDTVVSGISAAEAEADAAEAAYKTAFDAGDSAAVAKAQRKISESVSRLTRLQEAKADLEDVQKRKPADTQQQQRPAVSSDPVETYIAGRTTPTQNWLRQHKEWITDPKKNAKLTAAHYEALSDGLATDTPEYFERVEKFIGLKTDDAGGKKPAPQREASQRRQGAPTVPVGHAGGGTNGGGNEVRLTAGEARSATDGTIVHNTPDPTGKNRWKVGDAIGLQEMAKRKLALQADGRYDRAYLES